jgi:hypothetical protein
MIGVLKCAILFIVCRLRKSILLIDFSVKFAQYLLNSNNRSGPYV